MTSTRTYITTPIYYVNADPHIGHAHTSVMADVLKRILKMNGHLVFLSTGVDEHGQKNQEAAEKSGLSVKDYLDRQSARYHRTFEQLNVEFDFWVRTTNEPHKKTVHHILNRLYAEGVLVKKRYQGLYCVGCEMFKRETDLDEQGRCKDHLTIPELTEEENYFLRIGLYQDWLRDMVKTNENWIRPDSYRRDILRMIEEPFDDLCISRPKSRVTLGVELPFDSEFVVYVWFDALINYLSNLGWPNDQQRFEQWWPNTYHLMAKDIIKTHCIHWPCMLKALGINPPKACLVHGYWVGEGNVKMSKTIGNVVAPSEIIEKFGADTLRFYMAKNMHSIDSPISHELISVCHNGELGNNLGNLYSRVVKFAAKVFDGKVPQIGAIESREQELLDRVLEIVNSVERVVDLRTPSLLAQAVLDASSLCNQYFYEAEPWKLAKQPEMTDRLAGILSTSLECLRIIFEAAYPVLPNISARALCNIGAMPVQPTESRWIFERRSLKPGTPLGDDTILFSRV